MDQPALSRQKVIDYLKSKKIKPSANPLSLNNTNKYLYHTGANALIDTMLIDLYSGDFDEDS